MLKDHLDVRFTPSEFFRLFEEKLGWRPKPEDYGCSTKEAFITKLYEVGAILFEFDHRRRLVIFLPSLKPSLFREQTSEEKERVRKWEGEEPRFGINAFKREIKYILKLLGVLKINKF